MKRKDNPDCKTSVFGTLSENSTQFHTLPGYKEKRVIILEAFPLVKVKHEILPLKQNVNPTFAYLLYQSHTDTLSCQALGR